MILIYEIKMEKQGFVLSNILFIFIFPIFIRLFLIIIFGLSDLQLMDPTEPHPQRFEVYTLLPDKKGFTIKDCTFVFKLDRHGGWRDQYGHYYNANGQPDFEPEDAELTPSQGSIHSDDGYCDYDEFQPDYDNVDDGEDQQHNSWEIRNMERISRNMETLSTYPLGKTLRVYFSNMNFKTPPKSVYEAYSKKAPGIVNIIFDSENNLRNGQGHFIMEDAKKAEVLVKLQGEKVVQRQVHFTVESLSQLIIDPIKQKDLVNSWNPKGDLKPKYSEQKKQEKKQEVPKFKAAEAQKKQQPKKVEKQIKKQTVKVEQKKTEPKPVQIKKQVEKEFQVYELNFEIFSTKTKFFQWFKNNGGNKDVDIKEIKKEEKNGATKIFMEIKRSLVQKLNGKDYNGSKVKFTLANH